MVARLASGQENKLACRTQRRRRGQSEFSSDDEAPV